MVKELKDELGQLRDDVADAFGQYVTVPLLRGVSHMLAFFASIVTGVLLVVQATAALQLVASLVYGAGLSLALAASSLYHRVRWSQRAKARMRNLDHSMIFVLVASTYTPLLLLTFDGGWRVASLVVVWVIASAGVILRLVVRNLSRQALVAAYLASGWTAVLLIPKLYAEASSHVFTLVLVGGLLYTLGALVYLTRRPNPLPRIFGFHEVFHIFVLAAAGCHYAAVYPLVTA